MVKSRLTEKDKNKIIKLRQSGKTLVEIGKIVGRPKSTISRLTHDLVFSKKIQKIINSRNFGSKSKARNDWEQAGLKAKKLVGKLSKRDILLVTAALYWGEGNKSEFNIINSDPVLLSTVVKCLGELGVPKDEIKIGLRLYKGIDKSKSVLFWSKILSVSKENIVHFEHIIKPSHGKLLYGMCRVRVKKGARIFKLMMSVINLIKSNTNAAVVQWIEQGTPKS